MLPFHCFMNPQGSCEQRVVASQEGFTGFGFVPPLLCTPGIGSLSRTGEQSDKREQKDTVQSRNFGLLQQKPEVWLQASGGQANGVLAVAAGGVSICMWKCRRLRMQPPQGNETSEMH